jgi:hypothetical protein
VRSPRSFELSRHGFTWLAIRCSRRSTLVTRQARYNSIDSAHDGLLDVFFDNSVGGQSNGVRAVLFSGKDSAAPPGLPHLLGVTRKDLVRQFGEPTYTSGPNTGGEYFGFRNGILVLIQSGKTSAYGVYTRP